MSDAEVGTCSLCGQEMVRTETDCWHPWSVEFACPPEPLNSRDIDAWQTFYTAWPEGVGRPGSQFFVPLNKDVPGV